MVENPRPLPRGALNYTPQYNSGIVSREFLRRITDEGLFRACFNLATSLVQNLVACAKYSSKIRALTFNGQRIPYYDWHCLLPRRTRRAPEVLRFVNVISKFKSERAVELSIAHWFLTTRPYSRLIEIGNVLNYYFDLPTHDVLDKYEVLPDVINEDIVEFEPRRSYDMVISLSTLEHVGFDEQPYDLSRSRAAAEKVVSLMGKGGHILVTVPLGYNPAIDDFVEKKSHLFETVAFFMREGSTVWWVQAPYSVARAARENVAVLMSGPAQQHV